MATDFAPGFQKKFHEKVSTESADTEKLQEEGW
jgi:hypothetical protein